MPEEILSAFGIQNETKLSPFGTGLINHTWKVSTPSRDYILQKINPEVFKQPANIAHNIQVIADHLKKNHPGYFFAGPVKTTDGQEMLVHPDKGYFRLFPFVNGSFAFSVAPSAEHAYEAARQFGLFTRLISGIPVADLRITIPDFHNLGLRYEQFLWSVQHGNPARIKESEKLIEFIAAHDFIVSRFEEIRNSSSFKLRPTHHDTKISNVLFDKDGKGLCVVDLDTIMPGYFISDVGDMMRTYLCAASEEEKDFDQIEVRDEYFIAILEGYLSEMKQELTKEEVGSFVYSGLFMTYMQGIRFLTDYLNNDVYYGSAYEQHNYIRANNQATLLRKLMEKESKFKKLVSGFEF